MDEIARNTDRVKELCEKYRVAKLYVFGSAATKQLREKSDIDFLVTFENIDLKKYADNYFDLKFSLEDLFDRPVDLLEEKAIKNPYLRRSIDKTKKIIYG